MHIFGVMKRIKRNVRVNKRIETNLADKNLCEMARRARYIGSSYHKTKAWFGGTPAGKRQKKVSSSLCPDHLHDSPQPMERWLRIAILSGAVANFDENRNGMPKHVWYLDGEPLYRAWGDHNGNYHGYPLRRDEWPVGIEKINWISEN